MRRWCRALRPLQERRRDLETERLGGLEVDDQLELCWLLDGQVSGFRAFEDLVHVHGRTAEQVEVIGTVADECSGLGVLPRLSRHRQPVHEREIGNALAVGEECRSL